MIIDIGTNLSRQAIEIAEDSDNTFYINSDFLSEHIKPKGISHHLSIDINCKNSDEAKVFHLPYCKEFSIKNFDREYGFEIESILEKIFRA